MRRGRKTVIGAMTALVLVLTAACGGGDDDSGLPEQTTDASSVEDVLANLPTEPPKRPADAFTSAGAEAFSRHVVDVLWYTLAVGDGQAMADLDLTGSCGSCSSHVQVLTDAGNPVQVPDDEPKTVSVVAQSVTDLQYAAVVTVDFPSGRQIDRETKKVVDTFNASDGRVIDMVLSWQGDRWSLDKYTVEAAA
jgi:hypothetical protein